jgi:hypothetical protein
MRKNEKQKSNKKGETRMGLDTKDYLVRATRKVGEQTEVAYFTVNTNDTNFAKDTVARHLKSDKTWEIEDAVEPRRLP